jgi:hypothetical protein
MIKMIDNTRGSLRTLGAGVLVAAGCALCGCSGSGDLLASRTDYAGAPPSPLAQSEVLNIQVFRNVTDLELTNTTARSFGPSVLWINERYSRPIDGLAIGESLDLPLREFVDEFGDPFRAGGFFATRDPDPFVLAQLESDGVLYGLLVGGDRIK